MTPYFLPQPHLEPIPDSKPDMWVLVEDYAIDLPVSDRRLCIHAGFVTDGASIPRILWPMAGQPFGPSTLAPALVHDAITRARLFPRAKCDREFYELLLRNGDMAQKKAPRFYLAVRAGGWWPWIHHRRRGIQQMRQLVELLPASG